MSDDSDDEKNPRMEIVIARLLDAGVKAIQIEFDGSGDSGSVYAVEFLDRVPDKGGQATAPVVIGSSILTAMVPGEQGGSAEAIDPSEFFETWAYDILGGCGIDWVNNDGGYGTVTVDLSTRAVHVEMNERITSSELHEFEYTI
jgi:hypothetical protein